MAPELAYELVTGETPRQAHPGRGHLPDGPVLQPRRADDGDRLVRALSRDRIRGRRMPGLYHKFAGHDNNRDAVAAQLIESAYVAGHVPRLDAPGLSDHHHMGGAGSGSTSRRIASRSGRTPTPSSGGRSSGMARTWPISSKNRTNKVSSAALTGRQGPPRFPPADRTAQYRRAADRVRRVPSLPRRPSCTLTNCRAPPQDPPQVRGADQLPEPLARRLVEAARHRGAAEDLRLGGP